MFLFQKLNYTYVHLDNQIKIDAMFINLNIFSNQEYFVFDTETTGLNFMKDIPFLFAFGWKNGDNKFVYTIDMRHYPDTVKKILDFFRGINSLLFAHNTKYDYNMLLNSNFNLENINFADGMTVARLTSYADEPQNIGLEELGTLYVDRNAKFAGKAIKELLRTMKRERLNAAKKELKKELPKDIKLMDVVDAWRKRVQFVNSPYDEYFSLMDELYQEPTYLDVYLEKPQLMLNYAADDVVILIEYLDKAMPVLKKHYDITSGVFKQECDLIEATAYMERNGMPVDISYLLSSRLKVMLYIDQVYSKLWGITDHKYGTFSSGQHKVIMQVMEELYNTPMENCDVQALTKVSQGDNKEAAAFADLIIELRTLDKWLSTYIEGMLNRVQDGRIYTSINNSGAITGRVSSDMQQQPKEPLLSRDGEELFHPRKVFINDDGAETYYFDFSQMELRLQAEYTVNISGGDTNLCRAFIPINCESIITGDVYQLGSDDWNSGEWVDENGNEWTPTDLHSVTTIEAFPHLKNVDPKSDEFKHYRRLGKMCNFLKNYGGGVDAIKSQLGVDDETANKLNSGYYQAFPKILDYQKWIEDKLSLYGFVENIYGRRYYIQDRRFFYKAYNYIIQGGCADIVKEKEVKLYRFFKEKGVKSKILLPVHDELQVSIVKGEEWLVAKIKEILDDNKDKLKNIPMLCDVEVTHSNWADKEDF